MNEEQKELIKILTSDEKRMKFAYRDSKGILTIGVGRNIEQVGLSDDEIDYLLNNDVIRVTSELNENIKGFEAMPKNVRIVLMSMNFQLGLPRFLGFKKTIRLVEAGNYKQAAIEMLDSKWAKEDSPSRALRLSKLMAI